MAVTPDSTPALGVDRTDPNRHLPPHVRGRHCSDRCNLIEAPPTLLPEEVA